jgi:hypothetical protein
MLDAYATNDSPRCEECPSQLLDDHLQSAAGQLIAHVIDLDFALQAGVTVGLAEILYPEFLLLRLLTEERNRFTTESMKSTHHGR